MTPSTRSVGVEKNERSDWIFELTLLLSFQSSLCFLSQRIWEKILFSNSEPLTKRMWEGKGFLWLKGYNQWNEQVRRTGPTHNWIEEEASSNRERDHEALPILGISKRLSIKRMDRRSWLSPGSYGWDLVLGISSWKINPHAIGSVSGSKEE